MITIILNHHNKYAEVDMPAMYEDFNWLSGSWDWTGCRRNTLYRTWKQLFATSLRWSILCCGCWKGR